MMSIQIQSKATTKARWHRFALAATMAAALAACGGGSDEPEATAEEEAAAAAEDEQQQAAASGNDSASADDSASSSTTTTTTTAAADVVGVYVGKWGRCLKSDDGTSSYYTLTVSKTGANTARANVSYSEHSGTSCQGAATDTGSASTDLTVTGTKVADGKTVLKATIFQRGTAYYGPNPSKAIHWFNGNRFYEDDNGATDSEGYPVHLDMANPWIRK